MLIDPATLADEQRAGRACVVDDGHAVRSDAVQVGFLGPDEHPVFACPGCVKQLDALVLERDPQTRGPVGRHDASLDRPAVPPSAWPHADTDPVDRSASNAPRPDRSTGPTLSGWLT